MVCQCTLAALGYGVILYVVYRILVAFYNVFFPFFLGSPVDLHKKAGAKWAVVTGATDGIGKAYAQQLAKKRFNLLLISRTQSKLDETKAELLKENKDIEVRTFSFDFTASTCAEYQPLFQLLSTIEVGILVNNVGLSFEYPELLHLQEGGNAHLANITVANSLPPTLLSSVVLEQMVQRRAGIIVNISSGAAYNEMSYWNVYSASKRYLLHLSNILRREYEDKGITVQTVAPMLVATKLAKIRRSSFFGPFPDAFVKQALRSIGLVHETTGYFSHQLQVEVMGFLPQPLVDLILTKNSLGMRAAAIKKKAKAQ